MRKKHVEVQISRGFTLIELLIVIAIILILIAIALPNFLEAQIRAKVANSNGELRSLVTATEAYRTDWNTREPKTDVPGALPAGKYSEWWGFASHLLTTPHNYITSIPYEPFGDTYTLNFWIALRNGESDPPYTVVRNTAIPAYQWPVGAVVTNNADVTKAAGGPVTITRQWNNASLHSAYIYYSSGPDRVDSTVWGTPQFYSPTNGTNSFGDIYALGPGAPVLDKSKPFPKNCDREDYNY